MNKLVELFSNKGWHSEENVFNSALIFECLSLLKNKHARMRTLFEEWSNTSIKSHDDYLSHEKKLLSRQYLDIPKDHRHFLTGEFDLETRLDLIWQTLLTQSEFLECVKDFLKVDKFYIHYPPMLRFKVANTQTSLTPIHQDSVYSYHLNDFITIWIPFTQVMPNRGGIQVYEGSQALGVLSHEAGEVWASKAILPENSDNKLTHISVNTGDIILFPSTLVHQSAPFNYSEMGFSMDIRIFIKPEYTIKSYFDPFEMKVFKVD